MRAALLLVPLLAGCQPDVPAPTVPTAPRSASVMTTRPAQPPPPLEVTTLTVVEALEGEPTPLEVGQVLRISVSGNPSTGYVWELATPLPAGVEQIDAPPLPQPPEADTTPGRVGAPALQWIYLRATKAASGEVVLYWRRPWEKDTPPVRTVRYAFTVR